MTVFQNAIVECLAFTAFMGSIFGGLPLLRLYICWRIDQKLGRKWVR